MCNIDVTTMKAYDPQLLYAIRIASISFAVALAAPMEGKPLAAAFELEARLPGGSVDMLSLTDIFQTAFVQAGAFAWSRGPSWRRS